MWLLFFVNTNKIRNYSYIKGRCQCPFTSHETLRNNFSFHSNKGIHHMHYIWYGGKPLACPFHIPHNNHVFFIIIGPVNPQIFFLNWLRKGICQQLSLFWCSWSSIWNVHPTFGRRPRVLRDCATLLWKSRLFIFPLVILLKAINALHNARSIKRKNIFCHHFFDFLYNPYDDISISALSTPPI